MKIVKFAAGLAAGYVLGTRAGREKYEQIAATARKLRGHPTVVQAKQNAKALVESGTEKAAEASKRPPAARTTKPRAPRRKASSGAAPGDSLA
jgi:hypothetical protein